MSVCLSESHVEILHESKVSQGAQRLPKVPKGYPRIPKVARGSKALHELAISSMTNAYSSKSLHAVTEACMQSMQFPEVTQGPQRLFKACSSMSLPAVP